VDPVEWILSGGKVQAKAAQNGQFGDTRFGKVCDEYVKDQRQKQDSTLCGEMIHIRHLKKVLKVSTPIREIDLDTLKRYRRRRSTQEYHGKRISDATIKKELVTFRQVWAWAKQSDYVETRCPLLDDDRRWRMPFQKPNSREKFQTRQQIQRTIDRGGLPDEEIKTLWEGLYLDQEQVSEVLNHVRKHAAHGFIYPMFAFAAYTGARRSEILRAQIDDFDFEFNQIMIRERKRRKDKNGTTRLVPLHPKLCSIMDAWFGNHPGGPFTIQCPKLMPRQKTRTEWTGLRRSSDERSCTYLPSALLSYASHEISSY
jgi:integrase